MNTTQWCKDNGIPRSTFYRWRKEFKSTFHRAPLRGEIRQEFSGRLPFPDGVPPRTETANTSRVVSQPVEPLDEGGGGEKDASREAEVVRLRGENRRLVRELGNTLRFEDATRESIASFPSLPMTGLLPRTPKKPDVDLVLCLGDWHIGDLIVRESVAGLNAFDFGIAQTRMSHLVDILSLWVAGQRTCYNINTCHVFVLGDMVSGGIHLELLTDEEFPPPKQCALAGRLLAHTLVDLAQFFPDLRTTFLSADNHSRTTIKPRHKRKVEFSLGHVVAAITKASLPSKLARVFIEPSSAHTIVSVRGIRFLLQHGDYIRSYGITPDAAIEKAMMEEEMVRTGDNAFNVMVIGHFHRPTFKPHLVVNGSLCGRTEYEHSKRFRLSRPTQVSFLVHPDHGMFNFVPWSLGGSHV